MSLSRVDFKTLFKVFITFAVLYNSYRYFVPWDGNKPLIPFYVSILKDVPWAIVVTVGLLLRLKHRGGNNRETYCNRESFNKLSGIFVITNIVLLAVAIVHIYHKNTIDILQRDMKNIQYIFLPLLFPLLIQKESDIHKYVNWLMGIGSLVSIFGFIIYLYFPEVTWDGAVLSTFQSPNNYGFFSGMLLLILLSLIFNQKKFKPLRIVTLILLYGSLLMSSSLSALLTVLVGMLFLIFISRPSPVTLLKVAIPLIIISVIYFNIGLYEGSLIKAMRASSAHKKTSILAKVEESREKQYDYKLWKFLNKPYYPTPDKRYQSLSQYTTITGRLIYFREFLGYLQAASFSDILLGDFSLRNYFEYDNVYMYFIRNDGIIVTILLFILLGSGFTIGLNKFKLFRRAGNEKMAGLALGIAAFLLTSIIIQFNLSLFLTIYPLNFLTYFFLILIFFINPSEHNNNHPSRGTALLYDK